MTFSPSDERAHEPEDDAHWVESWSFDFAEEGGPNAAGGPARMGGFVRLVLLPAQRAAWYWAYLVGPDFGSVVVRDREVPMPRRLTDADLAVRSDALWAEVVCETPFEHWGLGLEAFGVRVDDPRDDWGERVAVGLDLEWEVVAPPFEYEDRYSHAGVVHGELLVGPDHFPFEGRGVRDHEWGELGWLRDPPWQRGWCCVGDELAMEVVVDGEGFEGWTWQIGEPPVAIEDALVETHGGAGRWVLNQAVEIEWEVVAETSVPIADRADTPRLARSLATATTDRGATGVGWLESVEGRF